MRKAIALTLMMLPSACAGVGTPASMSGPMTIPGAMNAPFVLHAQQTPAAEAQPATAPTPSVVLDSAPLGTHMLDSTPVRTDMRRSAPLKTTVPVTNWGTTVDYDHSIDRAYMLANATRNQDTSRPAFATLKRSFGTGEFRPYIGVGVGQASAKFGALDPSTDESYAVKGVLGGNLFFTKEVGGYVQYDYAIAAENPLLADDDKSHGISLGLSISLN